MSKIATRHIIDPETLAAMDAEFLAGAYDTLEYPEAPTLDPAADPFERNFEWLHEPQATTVDSMVSFLRSRSRTEWANEAGRVVRNIALAGSLAGGTDEQIFRKWINEGFVALCFAAGSGGEAILAATTSNDEPIEARVVALVNWLKGQPKLQSLSDDDRFAVAVAAVEHFSPSSP